MYSSYSVQTHTHKKTHILFATVALSLSPYISLVHLFLFCRKENPKGFKNHAHKFPCADFACVFWQICIHVSSFSPLSTWNFLCKPLGENFRSLCWICIPCCVLTGDAVKSVAIINRWIWIIPFEPDSHSPLCRKTHTFDAYWLVFAMCLGVVGRYFPVFPWHLLPLRPINNPPLLVTSEGPCLQMLCPHWINPQGI